MKESLNDETAVVEEAAPSHKSFLKIHLLEIALIAIYFVVCLNNISYFNFNFFLISF